LIKREDVKILKYKDLIMEIQHMWNVKANVITVITGVNETISKSLRQYLSNITWKARNQETAKICHIGHSTQCGMY
jgi:hypothetical protein